MATVVAGLVVGLVVGLAGGLAPTRSALVDGVLVQTAANRHGASATVIAQPPEAGRSPL
jgi:hypothetical protein